ncbi:MAG: V-type ATP synthase subunit I [Candidatus Hodarchaeota archaeon]
MTIKNQMSLINVVIKRNYKNQLLTLLSSLNAVHIKSKSEVKKEIEGDRAFSEKLKNLRQNLDLLFKKIRISDSDFQELKISRTERVEFLVKDLQELLNHTLEEINFFYNRVDELERYTVRAKIELENLNTINSCYNFLDKFNLTRESLSALDQFGFKVYTSFSKNLPNLKNLFEFTVFPNIYQYNFISDDRIVFYVMYPQDRENDLKERISIIHAEEIPILKKYLTPEGINFTRISKEIDLIKNSLSKYAKELHRIIENNLLKFAAINEVVENIEEYSWASKQFEELSSGRLVLKFFVPIEKKQEVILYLKKNLKKNIIINSIDISKKRIISDTGEFKEKYEELEGRYPLNTRTLDESGREISKSDTEEEDLREKTPTVMHNFFLFRPFETLTKLYGTPSYSEVDPTPVLFFTFPLLFGLMFGDIGHGMCLIIAGLIGAITFRKRKRNDLYNLCWIIFWCGWGAVLIGFLYGEFFGMQEIPILGLKLQPVPIYVPLMGFITLHNPLDNIMTLFIFVLLVGVFHINLGWFIQFLNYWKQKRKYLAFTDSLCKIAFLTGGTCLIFIFGLNINVWFAFPYPILLPLVPGLLLIILKPLGKVINISYLREDSYGELLGEGSLETFETVLSVLSNVASYIRLLALALAHIALMVAIQAMIGLIQGEGIVFQILIVIGLILGNLVVILIEGILVFINTIRLHFYEFFFKFYQGKGIFFFPFFLDEDYSHISFKVELETDVISEEIEKEIDTKETKEVIDKAVKYISDKFF